MHRKQHWVTDRRVDAGGRGTRGQKSGRLVDQRESTGGQPRPAGRADADVARGPDPADSWRKTTLTRACPLLPPLRPVQGRWRLVRTLCGEREPHVASQERAVSHRQPQQADLRKPPAISEPRNDRKNR